jgi:peptidylprolyl isomerase
VPTTDNGMILAAGMGEVIDGWDMCMLTMRLGEKCDCFIESKYAFGDEGRPPKIPGKSKVIFNIEIVQVGDRKTSKPLLSSKNDDELLVEATAKKVEGNEKFKGKEYEKAIKIYKDTIELLDLIKLEETSEDKNKINDLKVTTH